MVVLTNHLGALRRHRNMSVCLMNNLMIFRIWVLTTVSLLLLAHLALAGVKSFNRLSGEVVRLAEATDYDKATAVANKPTVAKRSQRRVKSGCVVGDAVRLGV